MNSAERSFGILDEILGESQQVAVPLPDSRIPMKEIEKASVRLYLFERGISVCFFPDRLKIGRIPVEKVHVPEIPQQPQSQESLDDQLRALALVANKLGFYDAHDWLQERLS